MRNFLIILITKIICFIMKLFGRTGGNLPGKLAYKWNKNIFKYFKISGKIIAVTGTNGKTMTNNAIGGMLKHAGYKVISNVEGNNMETGILSVLIKNCSLTGKISADYFVFETDESYVPVLYKMIPLDCLVVLDFFRDQLDRVGEVETVIQKINGFLVNYQGKLVLNGDDPNVARLGKANKKNGSIYYYHVEKYKYSTTEEADAGEGKFCPFCGARIQYEYYQYAHIGRFKCPNCYYGNNQIYLTVSDVDLENRTFISEGIKYETKWNTIYAMYNLAAVLSVAKKFENDKEKVKEFLKDFELNNGRLEKLVIKGCDTVVNMAKNPAGANVSLRLVNEDKEHKDVLFALNDKIADGVDVSWIWDINFEGMKNVDRFITTGMRPYDLAVRVKVSGFDENKIFPCENYEEALDKLYETDGKKYVIANFTAMSDIRPAVLKYKEKTDKE